jgi:nucleoside-diphosphate-sugar epimerase
MTDIRDFSEITEPQSKYAPLPPEPSAPHEWMQVDVSDYDQVLEASKGMDALINCTVLRGELGGAFKVSLVGAYNVMKAAVECGIKRVIHTGPRHLHLGFEGDYRYEHDLSDDVPMAPGTDLYALTKHLGGQVVRVFAERHDIEVITFVYCGFRAAHGGDAKDGSGTGPFFTSWEDTGDAFLYGLRAPRLPRNYEVFNILADLPVGQYKPAKAERLLGWKPKHNFERLYKIPKE